MNVYRICLRANGEITQLPDSQKVFGALIYALFDEKGASFTAEYVANVRAKNQKITLSGVMPTGYLPTPKAFLQSRDNPNFNKEIHKSIKERDYLSENDLLAILKKEKEIKDTNYVLCSPPYLYQQIRVGIDGDYRATGLPNNTFSVPKILCCEYKNNKKLRRVTDFCFFVQAESSSPIIELLQKWGEEAQPFVLGKRSSQGFNTYSFVECRPHVVSSSKSNVFLNMGMLLPNDPNELIDISSSNTALTLFTSERRPFEMGARWNKNLIKSNYLSFIAPGSLIKLKTGDTLEQVGHSIESPFDEKAIVFGNALLFPVEVA